MRTNKKTEDEKSSVFFSLNGVQCPDFLGISEGINSDTQESKKKFFGMVVKTPKFLAM